jgi:uncharacterized cupredoxin-like copper-binding protein
VSVSSPTKRKKKKKVTCTPAKRKHTTKKAKRYSFGTLASGEVESKTLALDAGTWSLFCALPQHAELGMTARLTVSG